MLVFYFQGYAKEKSYIATQGGYVFVVNIAFIIDRCYLL